jgi:uncharacterized membrane protein YfcA
MPGGWELIATSGIVLIAGVIVGLAGFGFALFAVPPLLFFHQPSTVVALVNILGFGSGLVVLYGEWHEVRRSTLRALVPWALIGLVAGTAILRYVDGIYIKLLVSVVVIAFAIFAAAGFRLRSAHHSSANVVAGLASGVLGTSAGLPGPPIALLFTARDLPPTAFRVTITSYFMIVDVVAVALLVVSDQLHRGDLWLALSMAPPALVGRWIGRKLADRVSPSAFRRVVIGLLLLTGASGAIGALVSLT